MQRQVQIQALLFGWMMLGKTFYNLVFVLFWKWWLWFLLKSPLILFVSLVLIIKQHWNRNLKWWLKSYKKKDCWREAEYSFEFRIVCGRWMFYVQKFVGEVDFLNERRWDTRSWREMALNMHVSVHFRVHILLDLMIFHGKPCIENMHYPK